MATTSAAMNRKRRPQPPIPTADTGPGIRLVAAGARPATVEVGEWRDPDDTNPNRREPRMIHGARVADPVHTMWVRGTISTGLHHAALRWARDTEIGVYGARPGAERLPGGAFGPGNYAPERQLAAYRSLEGATAAVGRAGKLQLDWVTLGRRGEVELLDRSIRALALFLALSEGECGARVRQTLERLAEHYGLGDEPPDDETT